MKNGLEVEFDEKVLKIPHILFQTLYLTNMANNFRLPRAVFLAI